MEDGACIAPPQGDKSAWISYSAGGVV